MEKLKGYLPQNNGAEIVPLRELVKKEFIYDTPVLVFPSKGKPFAAFLVGWKKTLQDSNPCVQLWAEEGQAIFSGGTTVCKIEDLNKFPQLEKKINAHLPEYRPKSYRYTEKAIARFLKKKLGSHSHPSSTEK